MPSLFTELRRRNVFKVGAAYAIVAWLLIEVSSVVLPTFDAPRWIAQTVTFLLIIGFPVALLLAWAFEMTPEGIKADADVRRDGVAPATGQRLNYVIVGLLVLAVGVMFVDNYVLEEESPEVSRSDDRRSIAVLPFENLSPDPENAFFADGIHGELLTHLSKIGSLKVISRTSVMEYRDSPKNMREIGQELGTATILEGDVSRAGNTVRINVQLIDAETDEHLWAEIYDRELTAENIFAIRSEMATSIAAALQTVLTPQELAQLSEAPTQNTRAHDFYLIGNEYYDRSDLALAEQMYERAVEEDPEFALAWTALSIVHSRLFFEGEGTESRKRMAYEAVQTALELMPGLPEAHFALGVYYYRGFRDYDRALQEYAIAEAGMPGSWGLVMSQAFVERRIGQWDEALRSLERAIELDPRGTTPLFFKAQTYMAVRNYVQAEKYLERVLEIAPDDEAAHFSKALIPVLRDGDVTSIKAALENPLMPRGNSYYWLEWLASLYNRDYGAAIDYIGEFEGSSLPWLDGYYTRASLYGVTYRLTGAVDLAQAHFQTARRQIDDLLETRPDSALLQIALGEALAGLGENESAENAARHGMELLSVSRDTLAGPAVQLDAAVRVLVSAQDHEAAIRELDDYFSAPGQWSIEGLLPDPRLDPIRDDPRFLALIDKYSR